jgi:uncharacterized membrane protein YidH (DUF202 family)
MIKSKLLLLLTLLLIAVNILTAEDAKVNFQKTGKTVEFTISDNLNLRAVADSINMPVKKLKAMFVTELKLYGETHPEFKGVEPQRREWDVLSIQELNIQPATVAAKFNEFTENTMHYGYSVTAVGIMVVFVSLLLISFLISQFQHIEKAKDLKVKKRTKPSTSTVQTAVGKVTGPTDAISSNAIVAVVAALHKHKLSVEERVKIQMTFSRTPVNMWSASAKMEMPNSLYNKPTDRRRK